MRARSGSRRSKARTSLSIDVDSPPGMTRPSIGLELGRTPDRVRASAPSAVRAAQVLADVALDGEHADARRDRGDVGPRRRRLWGSCW